MKEEKIVSALPIAVYAAYSKDTEERLRSSSGGIFRLLAECILSENGLVYGVAMSDDCRKAQFVRISELDDLPKLQGSKYLQASIGDAYKQVKADLTAGKRVLFSGTGCQVNGLKCFLGKESPNLFCLDVLCHGTPSPALWEKYVDHMEAEQQSKLININFRCKDTGWSDFGMKAVLENQKKMFVSKNVDPYMQMFLRDYCLRPSCYECAAKKIKYSDVTIADFWGINDVAPEMNDGKGISLIMVRTDMGMALLEKINLRICSKPVTYEEGVRCNFVEYRSVIRPPERDRFFDDMQAMDFAQLKARYAAPSLGSVIKQIKKILKSLIKTDKMKGSYGIKPEKRK